MFCNVYRNNVNRTRIVVNKIFLFCSHNACSNTRFQNRNFFEYVALCMVHFSCPTEEVLWSCQSLKEEKGIKFKSEEFFKLLQVAGFNSSTLRDRHLFYLEQKPQFGECVQSEWMLWRRMSVRCLPLSVFQVAVILVAMTTLSFPSTVKTWRSRTCTLIQPSARETKPSVRNNSTASNVT
jgi:hypothetical protein